MKIIGEKLPIPTLGTRMKAKAQLRRYGLGWDREELDNPIEGIFVGFRIKQNGEMEVEYDDMGYRMSYTGYFVADELVRTWLIAYDARILPLVCLPEDVEILS